MEPAQEADDYILDASKLSFEGHFDAQITEILTRVRLTRNEVESLQRLVDDLKAALSYVWPGCEVYPFGSIVTGLGIKTSDIDCFVQLYPHHIRKKVHPVIIARSILRKQPHKFADLFAITSAKVPILKFSHIPTSFHCDINFTSLAGVKNSQLVCFLLNFDARALPLAIIVKYWSKVYNLTGTNLMPNYALTIMVIFYLQVESILPSVARLQRHIGYRYLVEEWNTAFDTNTVFVSENSSDLYHLVGGFFNYYKSFDYEHDMISPFLGYPVKKALFTSLNTVPGEFELYKENVMNEVCRVIRLDSSICIQDPFEHSRNCSVAVFGRLFVKINNHFRHAATMFTEKQKTDFLRALFTLGPPSETAETSKPFKNKNKVQKKKPHQTKQNARFNLHRWYTENRKKKGAS